MTITGIKKLFGYLSNFAFGLAGANFLAAIMFFKTISFLFFVILGALMVLYGGWLRNQSKDIGE